ncbi:hypothetical protein JCM8097_005485 [Rhodosporidiobolus ruineniae]
MAKRTCSEEPAETPPAKRTDLKPAPRSSSSSPPRASFIALPPELKIRILEDVQDNDRTYPGHEVDRTEVAMRNLKELFRSSTPSSKDDFIRLALDAYELVTPCHTGLGAFSLVSREYYELARPLVWKHVNLGSRTASRLQYFVRDILPRQADFVTSVSLDPRSNLDEESQQDEPQSWNPFTPTPAQMDTIEATEHLAGVPAVPSVELRWTRQPALLIAKILRQCTRITAVDCSYSVPPDSPEHDLLASPSWQEHTLIALASFGPHLTSFDFSFDIESAYLLRHIPEILDAQPHLSSLALSTDEYWALGMDDSVDRDYRQTWQSLGALTELKHLSLALPLPPSLVGLAINSRITHLRLSVCERAPPVNLGTFLELFSGSMDHLDYHACRSEEPRSSTTFSTTAPRLPLFLPKLATLAYYSSSSSWSSVLGYFKEAPLRRFAFNLPYDNKLLVGPDVVALIQACAATLNEVEMRDTPRDTIPQGLRFPVELACRAAKARLHVVA